MLESVLVFFPLHLLFQRALRAYPSSVLFNAAAIAAAAPPAAAAFANRLQSGPHLLARP